MGCKGVYITRTCFHDVYLGCTRVDLEHTLSSRSNSNLLATDRSKAVVLVKFLLNVFGVGVSYRNLHSFVVYLYVNGSGSITKGEILSS